MNTRHHSKFLFYALFCFSLSVCAAPMESDLELLKACEFARFTELSDSDRRSTILKCSPDQQVELYIEWSSYTIPSNTDFANIIAKTGKALLPSLLARLKKRGHLRDDIKKPELLIVLEIMQERGYYAVSEDENLMAELEQAVNSIQEDYLKDWARDILKHIKSGY